MHTPKGKEMPPKRSYLDEPPLTIENLPTRIQQGDCKVLPPKFTAPTIMPGCPPYSACYPPFYPPGCSPCPPCPFTGCATSYCPPCPTPYCQPYPCLPCTPCPPSCPPACPMPCLPPCPCGPPQCCPPTACCCPCFPQKSKQQSNSQSKSKPKSRYRPAMCNQTDPCYDPCARPSSPEESPCHGHKKGNRCSGGGTKQIVCIPRGLKQPIGLSTGMNDFNPSSHNKSGNEPPPSYNNCNFYLTQVPKHLKKGFGLPSTPPQHHPPPFQSCEEPEEDSCYSGQIEECDEEDEFDDPCANVGAGDNKIFHPPEGYPSSQRKKWGNAPGNCTSGIGGGGSMYPNTYAGGGGRGGAKPSPRGSFGGASPKGSVGRGGPQTGDGGPPPTGNDGGGWGNEKRNSGDSGGKRGGGGNGESPMPPTPLTGRVATTSTGTDARTPPTTPPRNDTAGNRRSPQGRQESCVDIYGNVHHTMKKKVESNIFRPYWYTDEELTKKSKPNLPENGNPPMVRGGRGSPDGQIRRGQGDNPRSMRGVGSKKTEWLRQPPKDNYNSKFQVFQEETDGPPEPPPRQRPPPFPRDGFDGAPGDRLPTPDNYDKGDFEYGMGYPEKNTKQQIRDENENRDPQSPTRPQSPPGDACFKYNQRRLRRLCSFSNLREKRLSQAFPHICAFKAPACPIRETVASILRKVPQTPRKEQDEPAFHEYCTTDYNQDINRYKLITRPPTADGMPSAVMSGIENRGAKRKQYHR